MLVCCTLSVSFSFFMKPFSGQWKSCQSVDLTSCIDTLNKTHGSSHTCPIYKLRKKKQNFWWIRDYTMKRDGSLCNVSPFSTSLSTFYSPRSINSDVRTRGLDATGIVSIGTSTTLTFSSLTLKKRRQEARICIGVPFLTDIPSINK